MRRVGWNFSGLLVLASLTAIGLHSGCELVEPPIPPSTVEDGLGVQLVYPPADVWTGGKAPSEDSFRVHLYRLGSDSQSTFTQRPVFDDPPAVALEATGDEPLILEILAETDQSFWRLFVETGTWLGQTTFPIYPNELQRTVRVVLAEPNMGNRNAVILYDGIRAAALSEPSGGSSQYPTVIYAVGIANPQSLIGLDLRFVFSDADSATIYVDPGSRLYGPSDSDQQVALRWEMKTLDFVADRPAYRLEFTVPGDPGPTTMLSDG